MESVITYMFKILKTDWKENYYISFKIPSYKYAIMVSNDETTDVSTVSSTFSSASKYLSTSTKKRIPR